MKIKESPSRGLELNKNNFKFQRRRNSIAILAVICTTISIPQINAIEDVLKIPTSFQPLHKSPNTHAGPIDDATCHVEQLEEANDSQLFTILHDLKNTAFFRKFAVDLDATCPLAWNKKVAKKDVE
eukprot:838162_1